MLWGSNDRHDLERIYKQELSTPLPDVGGVVRVRSETPTEKPAVVRGVRSSEAPATMSRESRSSGQRDERRADDDDDGGGGESPRDSFEAAREKHRREAEDDER